MHELFYTDENTKLLVVVGNHDVGFHYDIIEHKIERFNRSFKGQYVQLIQPEKRNDINLIVLNSMSLENDKCKFCEATQRQLKHLNKSLNCLKAKECQKDRVYSRPILFTHFPLYRTSDAICPRDIDSDPTVDSKPISKFKEKYDTLSKESTKQV